MPDIEQRIKGNGNIQAYECHVHYNTYEIQEQKKILIIDEILDYVFSFEAIEESFNNFREDPDFIELKEKISINCIDLNEEKTVEEVFKNLWNMIMHASEYLEKMDNQNKVARLREMIQSKYRSYNREKNTLINVLDDMPNMLLPQHRVNDPDYYCGAKSIILCFFDHCDIGKKTVKELKCGAKK